MRYLTVSEVLILYEKVILQSGGSLGIRDLAALESAVAQPMMTYGGQDLYAGVAEKAVVLCYSLIMNHPFVDGNKRCGLAEEAFDSEDPIERMKKRGGRKRIEEVTYCAEILAKRCPLLPSASPF